MSRPLLLVLGLLVLSGCASHYVMRLGDGGTVVTASKPKLKNGVYYFKDARGQEQAITAGRVTEMEPASMAHQEMRAAKPHPARAHKRHWYLLWLA